MGAVVLDGNSVTCYIAEHPPGMGAIIKGRYTSSFKIELKDTSQREFTDIVTSFRQLCYFSADLA